jgi:signal transduction histidine kinase
LGRLLIRALYGQWPIRPEALADWTGRFVRRPPWHPIADLLQAAPEPSVSPGRVRLAAAARLVAEHTRWAPMEPTYWFALSVCSPADLFAHAFASIANDPALRSPVIAAFGCESDGLLRCTAVADLLIAQLSTSPNPGTLSSPLPLHLGPLDDVLARDARDHLLHDIRGTLRLRDRPLSPRRRRLLGCMARSAAYSREQQTEPDENLVFAAQTMEELGLAAARLIARRLSQPTACWFANETDGGGVGVVVDAQASQAAELLVRTTRGEFESTHIPTTLRISLDLPGANGDPVGRAYFETQPEVRLTPWLDRIGRAVAAMRLRQRLERANQASYVAFRETELSAQRRVRQRFRSMVIEFSIGAAHMIHNPLASITGRAQHMLANETDPSRRQSLHKMIEQVERVSTMIRDLHFIGRAERPVLRPVALWRVLDRAVAEAGRDRPFAELTLAPCDPSVQVLGDESDLVRLVSEIVANALDAAGAAGRVHVRARVIIPNGVDGLATNVPVASHRVGDSAGNGPIVQIDVIDSGPGFSAQDREHAFEPFYSGHPAGRGLGMGLAVARRIADDHDGSIRIGFDRPTTVTVCLNLATAGDTPPGGSPPTM